MGVLIGEQGVTRFSYLEYQALILCLALTTCVGWLCIEITMKRFQVLPVLFPGIFSVRERRFFFFDIEVKDGTVAGKIRREAKHIVHMTLFLVMSYLWQRCVMESSQKVGQEFPKEFCEQGYDCFASDLHYSTLLTRQHEPVDCKGPGTKFATTVVVSCINFVQPSAISWLTHLAIAHSLTAFHFKVYEVLVWVAGYSRCVRRLLGLLVSSSLCVFLGLFFGGVVFEFISSWLSFVMSMIMPAFLYTVWRSGWLLEELWQTQAKEAQQSMEEHFLEALAQLPDVPVREDSWPAPLQAPQGTSNTRFQVARGFLKMPMDSFKKVRLPSLGPWRSPSSDVIEESAAAGDGSDPPGGPGPSAPAGGALQSPAELA